MAGTFYDIQTTLENYMLNSMDNTLIVEDIKDFGLLDGLVENVNRTSIHKGKFVELRIQTKEPYTFGGVPEIGNLVDGGDTQYKLTLIPVKRVMANAVLTEDAIDLAKGGEYESFGNAVEDALRDMRNDFRWGMQLAALGNGYGKLARISAKSETSGTYTLTCDNTYDEMLIENVSLLKVGQPVSVYNGADNTKILDGVVTEVTKGVRTSSPTTGTVKIVSATTDATIVDNDYITIRSQLTQITDTTTTLPMGIGGIVNPGATYLTDVGLATFQGVTRSQFPCLKAKVYAADDINPGVGTPGTPTEWALSSISDAIYEAHDATDVIFVNGRMAQTLARLSGVNTGIQVVVNSADGIPGQKAIVDQYATELIRPDGKVIKVVRDRNLPPYVIIGICTDDIAIYPRKDPDFVREYGSVWQPYRGDRSLKMEAPYDARYEIGARRCDRCWIMLDCNPNI